MLVLYPVNSRMSGELERSLKAYPVLIVCKNASKEINVTAASSNWLILSQITK